MFPPTLPRLPLALLSSLLLLGGGGLAEELHPALKHMAEQYESGQKTAEASVAAQEKLARDGYLVVLGAARKREEAAGRVAGVTAIDAEVAGVKAGTIAGPTPGQLPADLGIYRDRYLAGMKQAATSNDSVRKHAREQYVKWLAGMEALAKGKDEGLRKAAEAERKRVLEAATPRDAGTR